MRESEYKAPIIINRPDLKTKTRFFTEWGLALAGWAMWFLLVRPFFLLLAWMIGYKLFYIHMVKYRGFENIHLFFKYGVVVLTIYLVLQGWNLYNARRFRGRERRKRPEDATAAEMADFFEMSEDDIRMLKQCHRVDVDFLKKGVIVFDSKLLNRARRGRFKPYDLEEKVISFSSR